MSYVCPRKECRQIKCFKHCNHCGQDIVWRPPLLDKEIAYNGEKPLDSRGRVHRCMGQGTINGKFYNTSKSEDSPKRIPNWVQNHYASIKENNSCQIESCFCHTLKSWNRQVIQKIV